MDAKIPPGTAGLRSKNCGIAHLPALGINENPFNEDVAAIQTLSRPAHEARSILVREILGALPSQDLGPWAIRAK
jgi:hypothetical protein